MNGSGTLTVQAQGSGGALTGTWRAAFPRGELAGIALINLATLDRGSGGFILNPPSAVVCANPLSTFAGTFFLEVTGTETLLSGRSRYFTCDDVIEGRVELRRQ